MSAAAGHTAIKMLSQSQQKVLADTHIAVHFNLHNKFQPIWHTRDYWTYAHQKQVGTNNNNKKEKLLNIKLQTNQWFLTSWIIK